MDTMRAFLMGEANRFNEMRVFDWNKAAKIIKESIAQLGAENVYAQAGLEEDWEYTGGVIFDGIPVPKEDTYTYLASTWAMPILKINGAIHTVFLMQSETEFDRDSYWPQSALDILNANE